MPVEKVKELRLQRRARAAGVEVGEERIVGLFQHGCGIKTVCDPLRKRRLADTNRSFDSDVLKRHEGMCRPGVPAMLSSAHVQGSGVMALVSLESPRLHQRVR